MSCTILPDTAHFVQFQETREPHGRSLVRVPTQIIARSPSAFAPLSISRQNAADTDARVGEDRRDIKVLLDALHVRYPAFDYAQYEDRLREQGIHYIIAASMFDADFYASNVGMLPGAAQFFCHWVAGVARRVPRAGDAKMGEILASNENINEYE